MIARVTANTITQYRVWVGRKAAGGAAFGGDGRIETGSAIAVGILEERPQPGKLFLGNVAIVAAQSECRPTPPGF